MNRKHLTSLLLEELNKFVQVSLPEETLEIWREEKLQRKLTALITDTLRHSTLKDPNAPTPARNAYSYFQEEMGKTLNDEQRKNRMSILGGMWRNLDEKGRAKWNKKAAKDKERFQKEDAKYERPPDEELAKLSINQPKSFLKDPNAPTRPKTALRFFTEQHREAFKKKHSDLSGKELTQAFNKHWHHHKEKGTKAFKSCEKKAKADKERYQTELKSYQRPPDEELLKLPENQPKKPKARRSKKKPKVKGARSSYVLWSSAHREEIKGENPDLDAKELMKKIAEAWKEVPEEEKEEWKEKAREDKERYEREKEELEAKGEENEE